MKNPIDLVQSVWQVIASAGLPPESIDTTQGKNEQLELQTLEERVLYDASPLGAAVADINESIETLEDIDGQIEQLNLMTGFEDVTPVMPDEGEDHLLIGEETPVFEQARQLIVIDERVDDVEAFIQDVLNNGQAGIEFDIIRLNPETQGIETITEALRSQGDQRYDAVHIVAHGSDAEIQLGATTLDSSNLHDFQAELSSWTSGLALGGDILLYGCDVAETEEGQRFVDMIGQWTGADVAASSDLTGNADLGGDWEFEYVVGMIETDLAFSVDVQQNWTGTLESVTVDTLDDVVSADADLSSVAALNLNRGTDGVISLREAIIAANANADADVIHLGAGVHTLSITGTGDADGGDLDILRDVQIIGLANGSSVVDGSGLTDAAGTNGERVFDVRNLVSTETTSATFQYLTITGGNGTSATSGDGGGIRVGLGSEVIVDNVVVTDNDSVRSGGGIANSGTLTVTNSTFSLNTAGRDGGGISANNGQVQLNNVTFSGNEADDEGGGVFLINGSHDLTNVTLSDNEAIDGGGIAVAGTTTTVDLTNVTIANNRAQDEGGGFFNRGNNADANIQTTIFSRNMAMNDANVNSGHFDDLGNNLISDDPNLLGDLADNGGLVETHAILGSVGDGLGHLINGQSPTAGGSTAPPLPPTPVIDLSSGIEINTDGNDVYLVADDGSAVFGGRGAFTAEVIFSSTSAPPETTSLLSYAANGQGGNDLFIGYNEPQNEVSFIINSQTVTIPVNGNGLFDGQPHSIALSWETSGDWTVYVDGQAIMSGSGVAAGQTIDTGGTLLFGQEQDIQGGNFDPDQTFSGTLFDVRVWDDVRAASEITDNYEQKLDPNVTHNGLIANWQFDQFDGSTVTDVVNGNNNLSVQNTTENGFTPNTPVGDLTVDENSNTGTIVGHLITTGGDPATTSFTLNNNDAGGRFAIDPTTGEITVADGSLLNFEDNSSHVIRVEVTDGSSTYEEDFTITVNDVNEIPVIDLNVDPTDGVDVDVSFIEDAAAPTSIATAVVNDGEGDIVSLTISANGFGATNLTDFLIIEGETVPAGVSFSHSFTTASGVIVDLVYDGNETFTFTNQAGTTVPIPADELQTIIRGIDFRNTSDSLVDDTIDFQFTLENSDGQQSALATSQVDVVAVNDAPILGLGGQNRLTTISENDFDSAGNTIAQILTSGSASSSDPDGDDIGVAIFTAAQFSGAWEFSTDGGVTWDPFGQVSSSNALLLSQDARIRFIPNADFTGTVNISYRAWDQTFGVEGQTIDASTNSVNNGGTGTLSTSTNSATIRVDAVNDAPVVTGESITVAEDSDFSSLNLLDNDSDPDGDVLTVVTTPIQPPNNGSVTLLAAGSFTYTPDPDFFGTDSFTYEVSDSNGGTAEATVDITVNSINDAPDVGGFVETRLADLTPLSQTGVSTFRENAGHRDAQIDIDGQTFFHGIGVHPTGTSGNVAVVEYDLNGATRFTAVAGINDTIFPTGNGQVIFRAYVDGALVFDSGSVDTNSAAVDVDFDTTGGSVLRLEVDPDGVPSTDHAVWANAMLTGAVNQLTTISIAESAPNGTFVGTYNGNDVDVGDTLEYSLVDQNGPFAIDASTGAITVVDASQLDFETTRFHTITVEIFDGTETTPHAVTIELSDINESPMGIDDAITIDEDTTHTFAVADFSFVDAEGDTLEAIRIESLPTSGTLALNSTPVTSNQWITVADLPNLTYTPAADGNSQNFDSFDFTVRDSRGLFSDNTNTLTFHVNPVNDAPVAVDDNFTTDEDTTLSGTVFTNDSDVDSGFTLVNATDTANGMLTVNPDGTFDYVPDPDFFGTDSFTYQLEDPSGAVSAIATVTITVDPVNDAPVAVDDNFTTNEDTTLSGTVFTNDSDVDSGFTLVNATDTANGMLTINADGTFDYVPDPDFFGTDSFTYQLEDPSGAVSAIATVRITVDPVNDAPVAVDDNFTTNEDTTLSGTVFTLSLIHI